MHNPLTRVIDMRWIWAKLRRNVRGATAIEYGLIAALIALAAATAIQLFATNAISMWNNTAQASRDNM